MINSGNQFIQYLENNHKFSFIILNIIAIQLYAIYKPDRI
jgi:hypothetical protein